jgi:polyisoprenoid-binding protein YceI
MNTRPLIRIVPMHFGRTCRPVVAVLTLALLCCAGAALPAQGWRIDETHTSVGFKIDAVGFPTTRGHFTHYSGRILDSLSDEQKMISQEAVRS